MSAYKRTAQQFNGAWRPPPPRPPRQASRSSPAAFEPEPEQKLKLHELKPQKLPEAVIAALLSPEASDAEKAQSVHQLNSCFVQAESFDVVERMAQQACRPKVVQAACELLVSGYPLGWMSLVFLRFAGYWEAARILFVRRGVLAAVLGVMRGWPDTDHRVRLGLELLSLVLGSSESKGLSPGQERAIVSLVKCGGCGMLCRLLNSALSPPPPALGSPGGNNGDAPSRALILDTCVELLRSITQTQVGQNSLAKCRAVSTMADGGELEAFLRQRKLV